jgi:hypothetical protein
MRKDWSVTLFAISLVAIVVQMVYTIFPMGGLKVMGPTVLVMPALIIIFGAALLWFACLAKPKWFKRQANVGATSQEATNTNESEQVRD